MVDTTSRHEMPTFLFAKQNENRPTSSAAQRDSNKTDSRNRNGRRLGGRAGSGFYTTATIITEFIGGMLVAQYYPPHIAEYQLLLTFGLAGVTKLFEVTSKHNQQQFPALPKWFWPICGLSELAISGLQYIEKTDLAMYLSFCVLGGIFCAVATLKNSKGRTVAQDTKGLLFLPVRLLSLMCIYNNNNSIYI